MNQFKRTLTPTSATPRLLSALMSVVLFLASGVVLGQTETRSESEASVNPNVGRWYQVEIILFQQREESNVNELWPRFPDLTSLENSIHLRQPPANNDDELLLPVRANRLHPQEELPRMWPMVDLAAGREIPFVVLPRPLLQMAEEADMIANSRGRSVILHTGWNMPVAAQENVDFIRIFDGLSVDGHHEIDGTLSIYVGRFLHVNTDVFQTRYELTREPMQLMHDDLPLTELTLGANPVPLRQEIGSTFRFGPPLVPVESAGFKESRRMRSNELHYIDHPTLGLLIQFTPYTPVEISSEGDFQEGGLSDDIGDDLEQFEGADDLDDIPTIPPTNL